MLCSPTFCLIPARTSKLVVVVLATNIKAVVMEVVAAAIPTVINATRMTIPATGNKMLPRKSRKHATSIPAVFILGGTVASIPKARIL